MSAKYVQHRRGGASHVWCVPDDCYAHARRVSWRQASGTWDTTSFFVGSILFACIVRCLAMASLCVLSVLNVQLSGGSDAHDQYAATPVTKDASFYSKAIEVLFNIGDFVTVSTYLSLVVVWVETFQHVRTLGCGCDATTRFSPAVLCCDSVTASSLL